MEIKGNKQEKERMRLDKRVSVREREEEEGMDRVNLVAEIQHCTCTYYGIMLVCTTSTREVLLFSTN